jgi:hypothetical protein
VRFGAVHSCPVPPASPPAVLAAMSPERAAEVTRNRQEALQRAGNNVSAAAESTLELHVSALFGAFTAWLGCPVRMCYSSRRHPLLLPPTHATTHPTPSACLPVCPACCRPRRAPRSVRCGMGRSAGTPTSECTSTLSASQLPTLLTGR